MKKLKLIFVLAIVTLSFEGFAQWNGTNPLWTNSNVAIGTTSTGNAVLKVYKSDLPTIELESSLSHLQIGMATCDGCFAYGAKPGDAVLRTLGQTNNIILFMPNDFNDGNSYIGIGDNANATWVKFFNNKTMRVNGKIYATEINVKTDVWSDNVFNQDYKLPKLIDVETYINMHKHLPDVPSEQVVKKDGVDLAQMNAKLLQKIEELTLYAIQQQKEIDNLKASVEELKSNKK